ncbi:DUF4389 domain-containing protein [Pseudonocardia abyssalis]|uniref:DUF4389 domain-containing protein n=1 Tax=Pseudonocardia abyssalis TaxID=2792008 RepID=A0ABS6US96_9PSEU|nr:DUF4389 domain-containing protein [Pseudonocardia abyssalis]MBW0113865.1 DUF4389 domain-containing protein [Pseudonocardia abyssalis]MBW0135138.1 DUF4389 domain-containing protein [Pseudonocardia abyssalis]
MASVITGPVRVSARLDAPLSRWLWLVKWLLVLPHVIVLVGLWTAFAVLSVVAFFAILFTGHYPRAMFDFNVGVLRWSWRVAYYTYGALGTDRYPPFTLAAVPDYPATLDVAYPEHLSRGLVLVKWWLLALPHYIVLAFFVGGGSYVATRGADTSGSWGPTALSTGGGLIGLLALIAGVALLFTGRYPRGVFDLLLGMQRWVLRVAAYSALMTDVYPPFRLDMGGSETSALSVPPVRAAAPGPVEPPPGPTWSAGRIATVVVGSILLVTGAGTAVGATAVLAADTAGRGADGFVQVPAQTVAGSGHALVFDPFELESDLGAPQLGAVVGDVRIGATAAQEVFVGLGPAGAVEGYLTGVRRDRVVTLEPGRDAVLDRLPGGAPATAPAAQTFWAESAAGPGAQELTWTVAEGRWAVVVMNADGSSPVVADLSLGATAPWLGWVWIGMYIGAALGLVGGAVLVLLAVRRGGTV